MINLGIAMKPVAYISGPVTIALLFLFIATALFPVLCSAELLDRVVAVVNEEVITLSDLEKEGERYYREIAAKAPAGSLPETLKRAREDVLDSLIEKRLIAQQAKAKNISVSKDEVEAAFQQMREQSGLSAADFLAKLQSEGMTEPAYREQLKNQVLQGKLVNADVRSKVVITDEDILDYYDTHYTSQVGGDGYYLLQIGTTWLDRKNPGLSQEALQAGKAEARKRVEEIWELAKKGEDFKVLAGKYSEFPSKTDGGDIGVFQLDEMAPYMQEAVKNLQPGGISEIIETPEGYQFFKLLNSQDGTIVVKTPFEQAKEEIRKNLLEQRLQKAYGEWMNGLKDQAYIQKL
jgi:peptidyl-prolyl cis-trans isomerase SurA